MNIRKGRTGIRKKPGKQPRPYWKLVHKSQNEYQWFHPQTLKRLKQAVVIGGTAIGLGVYGPKLLDLILGGVITRSLFSGWSEVIDDIKNSFK